MKKFLLLVLLVAFITGCGAAFLQSNVHPHESMEDGYAYVVGKKQQAGDGSYTFTHVSKGARSHNIPSLDRETEFFFATPRTDIDYRINKVKPGPYIFTYSTQGSRQAFNTATLGAVVLEAGKINYIGVFFVEHEVIESHWYSSRSTHRVTPKVTYDPEDKVKEFLKGRYPHMAHDIDSKFVVQPLRGNVRVDK
ncbi:MAG: hypothetical protein LBC79_10660 [Deltaproteobacteria bacterium]|jgi:hypothetical protein|nr:hypothetical protein [Deltaproteobacteria bacterium]